MFLPVKSQMPSYISVVSQILFLEILHKIKKYSFKIFWKPEKFSDRDNIYFPKEKLVIFNTCARKQRKRIAKKIQLCFGLRMKISMTLFLKLHGDLKILNGDYARGHSLMKAWIWQVAVAVRKVHEIFPLACYKQTKKYKRVEIFKISVTTFSPLKQIHCKRYINLRIQCCQRSCILVVT